MGNDGPTPQNGGERPKSIRLFIAINLPDEVKRTLTECQQELVSLLRHSSVRWTRPEQTHITLKFLGYAPADAQNEIERTLLKVCHDISGFALKANGLGCFPNLRSPRVIWVGITGDAERLLELQERCESAFKQWAEPEAREFKPHLTLARLKEFNRRDGKSFSDSIEKNRNTEFGSWNVRRIDLMQSHLASTGAEYTVLVSAPVR